MLKFCSNICENQKILLLFLFFIFILLPFLVSFFFQTRICVILTLAVLLYGINYRCFSFNRCGEFDIKFSIHSLVYLAAQ